MANELNLNLNLSFVKGSKAISQAFSAILDVAGENYIHATQSIGITEETLALGDVATSGFLLIKNNDATNYVELGTATGVYQIKMEATEPALFRVNGGSTIYAKATGGICEVEYLLIED